MGGEKSGAPVMAHLPAINQRRTQSNPTDKKSAQLEALAKFNARIANIDTPYTLRAGVNPKGASLTANQKDKADRATTEQVLDPRTRVILLKMIGRGLVSQINGVVSTGKEVRSVTLSTKFIHVR
jgi:RIO kinase 1